jgi:PEGA domain
MKPKSLSLTALAGAFLLSSCASIINGTHQTVSITTDPPGANVQIGGEQYISPVDASLARNRGYQIVASKPGYQTQTAQVESSFSAITILDTVFWIPWVVDLADGAAWKLDPETIQIHLQPATEVGLRNPNGTVE